MTTFENFIQECTQRQTPNAFNIAFLKESKFIARRLRTLETESDSDNNSTSVETSMSTDENSDLFKNLASFTKETNTFDVIELIGSGGFGVVAKVINRNIKDQVYAIKRVPLERNNAKKNQKILREADLLSRLNHCNVVRYYHTWREIHDDVDINQLKRSRTQSTVERVKDESLIRLHPSLDRFEDVHYEDSGNVYLFT